MRPHVLFRSALALLCFTGTAHAQYPGWANSGSIYILTTPEGADLPDSAVEKDFPLLVRLNRDSFDFSKAQPGGGCHYPLTGWAEFARLVQPQIERDHYGLKVTQSITPPNLKRAYYTSPKQEAIALEFDQPVVWTDALVSEFYPDGAKDQVASGTVSGNILTLILKAPSTAQKITYLQEMTWSESNLLRGENGIAALTFCNVPIQAK